jgi:hypothetical protein
MSYGATVFEGEAKSVAFTCSAIERGKYNEGS